MASADVASWAPASLFHAPPHAPSASHVHIESEPLEGGWHAPSAQADRLACFAVVCVLARAAQSNARRLSGRVPTVLLHAASARQQDSSVVTQRETSAGLQDHLSHDASSSSSAAPELRVSGFTDGVAIVVPVDSMPPEMAAITHAAMCSNGRGAGISERVLRRKLGTRSFSALRADTCGVRAMLSAGASGLMSQQVVSAEVRSYLLSAWQRFVAALAPCSGRKQLQQAASLFGSLLAAVPEVEAREGLERVLFEWACPPGDSPPAPVDSRDKRPIANIACMLQDHMSALSLREKLGAKSRCKHARQVLKIVGGAAAKERLEPHAVAESVAIVAKVTAELQDESVTVFKDYLVNIPSERLAVNGMWGALSDASASLRLLFLDKLAEDAGVHAWKSSGVDAINVAEACADYELAKTPASSSNGFDATTLIIRLLGQLSFMCVGGNMPSLDPDRALILVYNYGDCLGQAGLPLLHALLNDLQCKPTSYDDATIFSIAGAVDCSANNRVWHQLATALLEKWDSQEPTTVLEKMFSAPQLVSAAPRAFQQVLLMRCKGSPKALATLCPNSLATLIDAWARLNSPVPLPLQQLLSFAVEKHLHSLNIRRLVSASRMIIGEQERPTAFTDVRLLWDRWMECMLDWCRFTGYSRCRKTLRAIKRWYCKEQLSQTRGKTCSAAEQLLHTVIAEQLCDQANEAPLAILFELGRLVNPQSPVAKRLSARLTDRVWLHLRGHGGGLKMVDALAVSNGETLVACTPETKLWAPLTALLASQLRARHDIDLFCRSRPRPALRNAVMESAKDWCALELQMRLA